MSNQGCYSGFLVAAIALGLFWPDAAIARAIMVYGLVCVIVAGIWGGVTVSKKIFFIQALPAALALGALFLAKGQFADSHAQPKPLGSTTRLVDRLSPVYRAVLGRNSTLRNQCGASMTVVAPLPFARSRKTMGTRLLTPVAPAL